MNLYGSCRDRMTVGFLEVAPKGISENCSGGCKTLTELSGTTFMNQCKQRVSSLQGLPG